jgi:hypothetical protein
MSEQNILFIVVQMNVRLKGTVMCREGFLFLPCNN